MNQHCYYAEWEMSCCGTGFAIGSRVVWPVRSFSWVEGLLPPEVEREAGPVDYCYDKHGEGWENLHTIHNFRSPAIPREELEKEGPAPRLDAYLVELRSCIHTVVNTASE